MSQVDAEFGCDPASVEAARAFVDAALRVWHLDDLTEIATLLTSELVTNVVIHARTSCRVVARLESAEVVVEVFDGSAALPSPPTTDPYAEGGRGLLLVQSLADRWGVRATGFGKSVWFALAATG